MGKAAYNTNGQDGVHVGGEYYRAVNGVVEVPDNVTGLEQLGFTYVSPDHPEQLEIETDHEE